MYGLWGLIPFILFVALSTIFMGIWVYNDAKNRNMKAGLWAILAMSGNNCTGLFHYLIFKRKKTQINFGMPYKKYIICFAISMVGVMLSFFVVVYQMITSGIF